MRTHITTMGTNNIYQIVFLSQISMETVLDFYLLNTLSMITDWPFVHCV